MRIFRYHSSANGITYHVVIQTVHVERHCEFTIFKSCSRSCDVIIAFRELCIFCECFLRFHVEFDVAEEYRVAHAPVIIPATIHLVKVVAHAIYFEDAVNIVLPDAYDKAIDEQNIEEQNQ